MGLVDGTPRIKRYPAPRGQKKDANYLILLSLLPSLLEKRALETLQNFSPGQYSARTFFEAFRMSSLQDRPLHQVHPSAEGAK